MAATEAKSPRRSSPGCSSACSSLAMYSATSGRDLQRCVQPRHGVASALAGGFTAATSWHDGVSLDQRPVAARPAGRHPLTETHRSAATRQPRIPWPLPVRRTRRVFFGARRRRPSSARINLAGADEIVHLRNTSITAERSCVMLFESRAQQWARRYARSHTSVECPEILRCLR